jgi:ribosomal protein S18 acetylase RimI-like enzyme
MVREATPEDVEAIVAVSNRAAVNDKSQPHPVTRDEVINSLGGFVVREIGGQVIGCVYWRRRFGREAEFNRMAVDPDHERQGHARALLEYVESRARAAGVLGMRLTVWSENDRAVRLYWAAGYQEAAPPAGREFSNVAQPRWMLFRKVL